MKITAKKQVSSTTTNQSVNLGYPQLRENLVKKDEVGAVKYFDRRKGDRRKSIKARKTISFGENNPFLNLGSFEEKKALKVSHTNPNESAKAYQKTLETHANWQFPARLTLKEV